MRSEAQIAARMRNHTIWRLRGLWWNLGLLSGPELEIAREQVDAELKKLGAEPEGDRDIRRRKQMYKDLSA